jgi:lon-related putative ATP-dependent protease
LKDKPFFQTTCPHSTQAPARGVIGAEMTAKYELKPSQLRKICHPNVFKFKNTTGIKPLDGVIGQQRAVQSIEFGLSMKSPGYNIFVTGIEGTGKSSIVRDIATKHARKISKPPDWCLVNNFTDEFRPKALAIRAGKGIHFSRLLNKAVEDLRRELPQTFESEAYKKKTSEIRQKYTDQQQVLFEQIDQFAADHDIQIETSGEEFRIIPVVDGKPLAIEDLESLPGDRRAQVEANIARVQARIEATSREIEQLGQALRSDIEKLLDVTTRGIVKALLAPIRSEFKRVRPVQEFLTDVEGDIVENVHLFLPAEPASDASNGKDPTSARDKLQRYQVNILVSREGKRGAPVIYEPNPSYHNVFGRIEKRPLLGTIQTDFSMVQAGSMLQADGGYLIMDAEPVLINPFVWDTLKRSLQTKMLYIEDIAEETGFGTVSLRPEPIPLDVKVILMGDYGLFETLQELDSKFNKIFKVRADFDHEVERTDSNVQLYARFIARICKEDHLLPFTPAGVAAIVEFGEKHVANQNKLSIRFGPIQAVVKEADYWARQNGVRSVSAKYVHRALSEFHFRNNLYEEKVHESYTDETIMIDVDGAVVGQVNALAVYEIGEFSFGRPARITAEVYMGKPGIINIEREVELSGSTHDKGVLILTGYLGRTFAQDYPLSLSISITFEQSYGEIDGDSASSTELYAILSSLSGIPIRQGIAVTGSVNQKGQVQAIGGINQKIEGFFDVCKEKGLTGSQGVLMPKSNMKNLMLRHAVIEAVKHGRFHIYAVSTVEEGIELLTGMPAGIADGSGVYPKGTVYAAVQKKLRSYLDKSLRLQKRAGLMGGTSIDRI